LKTEGPTKIIDALNDLFDGGSPEWYCPKSSGQAKLNIIDESVQLLTPRENKNCWLLKNE
jgi:hypothetical protein